jgi:sec-independent protein translocase protein TatA
MTRLFGLGLQELVIILLVILVLFGGRKIPEIFRGLGQGLREFKDASRDRDREGEDAPNTKRLKGPRVVADKSSSEGGQSESEQDEDSSAEDSASDSSSSGE